MSEIDIGKLKDLIENIVRNCVDTTDVGDPYLRHQCSDAFIEEYIGEVKADYDAACAYAKKRSL